MVINNAYGKICKQDTNNIILKKTLVSQKIEVLMNSWQYRVAIEIHQLWTNNNQECLRININNYTWSYDGQQY